MLVVVILEEKNMKKFISLVLILLINCMSVVPALAEGDEYLYQNNVQNAEPYTDQNAVQNNDQINDQNNDLNNDQNSPVLSTEIEEETIYLSPKSTFVLELESDMDINETNKDDEIYFSLVSKVLASNGMPLPEHTRFVGKFKKISKSKPMFKRARAYIVIDKIIFPNDKVYTVRMEPKKGSDLKASQFLNTIRAIPAGIGIVAFSAISVAVVAIESVTVVGLVVVPRTCRGFGLLISSMAKGLNYKMKAGNQIVFKLDTPVSIQLSDVLSK